MVKSILSIYLLLVAFSAIGQASKFDRSKELGIALGTAYYLGELNPYRHFGGDLKISAGLIYRDNLNKRWTIRGSIIYSTLGASDSESTDPMAINRNLSFRNTLVEGAVGVELNYFDYQISDERNAISPYLFLCLAMYNMKPEAEYNGYWYELQPLGTEGQGTSAGKDKYKTAGMALPFGFGLKANIAHFMSLSLELGFRKTWSDYIDDVSTVYANPGVLAEENGRLALLLADKSLEQSGINGNNEGFQRGDPGNKDWYSFAHIVLSFRIDKKPNTCWD